MSQPDRWILAAGARRELRRLDPPLQRRIVAALDRLTGEPAQGNVVKLSGSDDEWRLRVGDWRVRFTRGPDGQIHVLRILPRGRAYDR